MEKIEQIDIGDTRWELNDALEEYKPDTMAKVLDKMVEIIDHLSSQDQEEEIKNPEYDGIREVEKQKFKNIVDTVNKRYPQDTPEQIESDVQEWEKDIRGLLWRMRYSNIKDYYEKEYVEELVSKVKQLLEEKKGIAYSNGAEDMFKDIKAEATGAGDLLKWIEDMQLKINKLNGDRDE